MSTSGGSGSGLTQTTVHVGAAAISTLFSAPVTLVAAPGAGKMTVVHFVLAEFVAGVCAYDRGPSVWYVDNTNTHHEITAEFAVYGGVGFTGPIQAGTMMQTCTPGTVGPISEEFLPAYATNAPVVVACTTGNPIREAPIVTAALAVGGAGYVIGDTGNIVDPNTGDTTAAYVVDTVGVAGTVATFHLTNLGGTYTTVENPLATTTGGAQPGVGTGFTVNVAAVHAADGDLYMTAFTTIYATH